MKARQYQRPDKGFMPIHMPKNTWAGFVISALAGGFGFCMIWQMWLLGGVAFALLVLTAIIHTFNYKRDYYIPADDVVRIESDRTRLMAAHV